MERWRYERATRPLDAWHPAAGQDEHMTDGQGVRGLAEVAGAEDISQTPTVSLPAVRPARENPRAAPATRPIQVDESVTTPSGEDEELERIREILVGPHLREHDRRLREVERRHTDLLGRMAQPDISAEWQTRMEATLDQQRQAHETQRDRLERALEEARTESQIMRAELTRERQAREELARSHAAAIADLTNRLDRARMDHGGDPHIQEALDALRTQHDVLRAELARERMSREEHLQAHARTLGELTNRLGDQHDEHARAVSDLGMRVDHLAQQHEDQARQIAARTAEMEARMERDRQARAEQLQRLENAQALRGETLRKLLTDSERTLVAMQAERQALTAQLAELRLHVLRNASDESVPGVPSIHREPGI